MNEFQETEVGKLPSEAKLIELGKCIDLIIDHRGKTPKKLGSDWVNHGVRAISAKNVHDGKLSNQEEIRYVTYETYKKWMKEDVRPGDCLIASEGATLGEHLYWDYDFPVVLGQRLFCIRTNPRILYPKYFYAYVTTSYFQSQIHGRSSGTSVFGLRQTEVLKMLIPIVGLDRQKAIGEIHYIINKKIDLLHSQNATLEAMAETFFRQWFVEEAKEEWEDGRLGDVIDIYDNLRIPLSKLEREKKKDGVLYPYYGAAQIMDYINEYIFDGDYILFGEDGTVRTDEGFPVLQYATGKFWVNNHTHVIRAKPPYTNFFIWNYLSKRNIDEIITGAVQPKINQGNLIALNFPKYPETLVTEFNLVSEPLFNKINHNKIQIKTLTDLRDTLLPKLMSGEIKVN